MPRFGSLAVVVAAALAANGCANADRTDSQFSRDQVACRQAAMAEVGLARPPRSSDPEVNSGVYAGAGAGAPIPPSRQEERRYDAAYIQCLTDKGDPAPGYAALSSSPETPANASPARYDPNFGTTVNSGYYFPGAVGIGSGAPH